MLDPLRWAKPEVEAEPTGPQNTIKNCLSYTHKAKDHGARSLSHGRGEAHLAQPSQGASYRSYNEGQGRPLTRKTSLVNDVIPAHPACLYSDSACTQASTDGRHVSHKGWLTSTMRRTDKDYQSQTMVTMAQRVHRIRQP